MAGDRLAPHPQVVMTELGDGTGVLLHLDTKFYYSLNASGVFLWKSLIAGKASLGELAEAMTARFDVEPTTAERDAANLVTELVGEGLVTATRP